MKILKANSSEIIKYLERPYLLNMKKGADLHFWKLFIFEPLHGKKPTICIGKNKGADQLRINCGADQCLCFFFMDSTIPLFSKFKISSLLPSSETVQAGLCQTWSEPKLLVFSRTGSFTRLKDHFFFHIQKLQAICHLISYTVWFVLVLVANPETVLILYGFITIACPCNEYPLIPHFYIVKLGNTGVYLFFFFLIFDPKT